MGGAPRRRCIRERLRANAGVPFGVGRGVTPGVYRLDSSWYSSRTNRSCPPGHSLA